MDSITQLLNYFFITKHNSYKFPRNSKNICRNNQSRLIDKFVYKLTTTD